MLLYLFSLILFLTPALGQAADHRLALPTILSHDSDSEGHDNGLNLTATQQQPAESNRFQVRRNLLADLIAAENPFATPATSVTLSPEAIDRLVQGNQTPQQPDRPDRRRPRTLHEGHAQHAANEAIAEVDGNIDIVKKALGDTFSRIAALRQLLLTTPRNSTEYAFLNENLSEEIKHSRALERLHQDLQKEKGRAKDSEYPLNRALLNKVWTLTETPEQKKKSIGR